MVIPPKYKISSTIAKHLGNIEAIKQIIDAISISQHLEINIVRQSTLKSSLFSARIEGNPLSLSNLPNTSSKDIKKIEVFNILKALGQIKQKTKKDITKKNILLIHEIVMNGLTTSLGRFRTEVSAIFNQAGIALYLPPTPKQIDKLIDELLAFVNSKGEENIPIRACLAHFVFEKIHPFLDGNGRVGRILLQQILQNNGYSMHGMLTIEEYLDTNRPFYYKALENKSTDVTQYLEFMLGAISESAKSVKDIILKKNDVVKEDYLLPRRLEILNIIRDHRLVNFDQIHRRFMAVNARTLRFDLKKLIDSDLIKKRGTTKGVYYESKE